MTEENEEEEEEKAPIKSKKEEEAYVLKEVVTQTDVAVGKTGTEEALTDKGVQLEMLNLLNKIYKAVK